MTLFKEIHERVREKGVFEKALNEATHVPEIVKDNEKQLKTAIKDKDKNAACAAIRQILDKKFGAVKWSMEKEEWDKMNAKQKAAFCATVYKHLVK